MDSNYISVRPYKHQVLKSENTMWNPVSFRKNKHFCQVHPVDVLSTDPEPVTSKAGTKNTSSTHVKPSIPYSLQVTIDPDGILTRETVQGMKDSLTRNDTVFNPILHRYNGQAGPFKARVNASTEKGPATLILSWTAVATSSPNLNPWGCSRILKMWESQLSK